MSDLEWWRTAVVYQVYPRSFRDSDGDGMGDLPGVIERLDYIKDLGVDAIWLNPFYLSPMLDAGYDVADYERVTPELGTTADAERLIAEAHARGLKVLFDIVPNHVSWEHEWFKAALASEPGSPEWARFHLLRGRDGGSTPPTNWMSVFGGSAWEQVGDSGWWYLHIFDVSQPDVNWDNPEVAAEFERVMRFWFDRGVDGFRIDVAHGLVKEDDSVESTEPPWDQPGVHDIYRDWRRIADSYDPPRVFCAEAWVETLEREAAYVRPDELHTAFNFHFLKAGWDATHVREVVDRAIATTTSVGAPATWVLSNHDVVRHTTRLGGRDRGLAMTLFMLALPGSAYLYQGEELGLEEVSDLPDELRQDPAFRRTAGQDGLRDGCRVPIPWTGHEPQPWLPQPADWAEISEMAQRDRVDSPLALYRRALQLRRELQLGEGVLEWLETGDAQVLAIKRGSVIVVIDFAERSTYDTSEWGTEIMRMGSCAWLR